MALSLAVLGFLGVIAYESQSIGKYKKVSSKEPKSLAAYQINEDIDKGISSHQNIKFANSVFSDEVGGIIRSDQYTDIHNVKDNALDFTNKARIKNQILGEVNFRPDTRSTVQMPSYGTKITGMIVPNPNVIHNWEKVPNAWLDKQNSDIRLDQRAWLYKQGFGENIQPFNRPQDHVFEDVKFGNPWGFSGPYNQWMKKGGDRLDGTHDYDPKIYPGKHVSFQLPNGDYRG